MDQIVIKSEDEPNEEVLLFYVDEDGGNEEGVVTTVENIEQIHEQQLKQESCSYADVGLLNEVNVSTVANQLWSEEIWTDEEINRLLIFYIDNKPAFLSDSTREKHLWSVACKTMLLGKNPNICVAQLNSLKEKFGEVCLNDNKDESTWPLFDLCFQAFREDPFVLSLLTDNNDKKQFIPVEFENNVVEKKSHSRTVPNKKVEKMLKLYLQHKSKSTKSTWDKISTELGKGDGEYWRKRFLNFKQHYIRLVEKRDQSGFESINWPYMELFDEIFRNDKEFKSKYVSKKENNVKPEIVFKVDEPEPDDWNTTERTVLGKYYFDCFNDFLDPTIPKKFLWNEVGRLLDKTADECKSKFFEFKRAHIRKYHSSERYYLRSRTPIEIIFDNIIAKEVQQEFLRKSKFPDVKGMWRVEEINELVQFIYDNLEMFKDTVCYYVCWLILSERLKRSIKSCKSQWDSLVKLYRNILNNKKDNPDMSIDWTYIEVFDKIFDYGMDTKFLNGYDTPVEAKTRKQYSGKSEAKKKNNVVPKERCKPKSELPAQRYKNSPMRRSGDPKAFKILEYYQTYKDKFMDPQYKKYNLWQLLSRQIGLSPKQCSHKLRNLKQVYCNYAKRQINKPEMPVTWPYYSFCKKIFADDDSITNNMKTNTDNEEDWSGQEISQLLEYLWIHHDIITEPDDQSKWRDLALMIHRNEKSCADKFQSLRNSYRKLKNMKSRNPGLKISWPYFDKMNDLLESEQSLVSESSPNDLVSVDDDKGTLPLLTEIQDEDYECIIVLPEGQEISDLSNAQVIIQNKIDISQMNMQEDMDTSTSQIGPGLFVNGETLQSSGQSAESNYNRSIEVPVTVFSGKPGLSRQKNNRNDGKIWKKEDKKRLVILYWNYAKTHKRKDVNLNEMWTNISSELRNKTPASCKKMFALLKNRYLSELHGVSKTKSPYYYIMSKIMSLKTGFDKKVQLKYIKSYENVFIETSKLSAALNYYLKHIKEFTSPMYDVVYMWSNMAKILSEPLLVLYHKINYLINNYNIVTEEVAGQKTPHVKVLTEIVYALNAQSHDLKSSPTHKYVKSTNRKWKEDEIEQLLIWYLSKLETFKNPKYNRNYIWKEVSNILQRSPVECSRKMTEMKKVYLILSKKKTAQATIWRFYDLCQKIYG